MAIVFPIKTSAATLDFSKENLDKVKWFVEKQFQNEGIVGGSYAIISANKVIDSGGVGYRDRKGDKKATDETIYAIASVTKAFTATAILQLQEQGTLNLDDPVQKYIPWFTYKDKEKSNEVTIKHLLTHSAGINRMDADGAIFLDEKNNRNSLEHSIRALRMVNMTSGPGVKGQYCNTCYNTLGLLIEKVSGMSYYNYMDTFIYHPLGMNSTSFGQDLKRLQSQDFAKEYSWFFGFRNTKLLNYQVFGKSQDPEGGMYTNSLDLAKYVSSMLEDNPASLLSQETLKNAYEGVIATERDDWMYTVGGFELGTIEDQAVLYKGGDGIGSSAAIMMIPEEQLGVVLLIGESNSEPKKEMAMGMLQILMGDDPVIVDYPASLFKIAGYVMICILIVSICVIASIIWSLAKRRHKISKSRLLRFFLSLLSLIGVSLICYLFLFVRPTQIGFFGYLYDWTIGLISLGIMFAAGFIYNLYLGLFRQRKRRDYQYGTPL